MAFSSGPLLTEDSSLTGAGPQEHLADALWMVLCMPVQAWFGPWVGREAFVAFKVGAVLDFCRVELSKF